MSEACFRKFHRLWYQFECKRKAPTRHDDNGGSNTRGPMSISAIHTAYDKSAVPEAEGVQAKCMVKWQKR